MRAISITILLFIMPAFSYADMDEWWSGHVYPFKNNLAYDVPIGIFTSLRDCRVAAQHMIRLFEWEDSTYECGMNCRWDEELEINICKKTLQ